MIPSTIASRLSIVLFILLPLLVWADSQPFGASISAPSRTFPPTPDAPPAFLSPDQAFRLEADYGGGDSLELHWQLAPGYYLYKQRFLVKDSNDYDIPGLVISRGEPKTDEWFGEMDVHYGTASILVPVPLNHSTPWQVKVGYQGCADAGLCYPIEYRNLLLTPGIIGLSITPATAKPAGLVPPNAIGRLAVKPAQSTSLAPTASPPDMPEAGRLAALLQDGSLAFVLGLFFLAGIGLAFTPCVLPMAPILSAIIVGAREPGKRHAFLLSLAYVSGMAVTYAAAGALMGFFGARLNIQAALQNPWLLTGFAALFALLALSMFGLYELRLPSALQDRVNRLLQKQSGGSLSAVALMGAVSALVVSPCISAPLAGALIYISTYQDVVVGAAALFVLALGMGIPLLLLGLGVGHLLPRTGPWMDTIKTAVGFGLLGLAVWLLERIISAPLTLMLWGILAIGISAWLGTKTQSTQMAALRNTLRVLCLVYGIALVIGAASGANNLWRPLAPLIGSFGQKPADVNSAPEFVTLDNARVKAMLEGVSPASGPAMLYIYADWCTTCRSLELNTFQHPEVQPRLAGLTLLKLDITKNTPAHKMLLDKFNLFGPPALLFFNAEGMEIYNYRLQGELSAASFVAHLESFLTTQF